MEKQGGGSGGEKKICYLSGVLHPFKKGVGKKNQTMEPVIKEGGREGGEKQKRKTIH